MRVARKNKRAFGDGDQKKRLNIIFYNSCAVNSINDNILAKLV